MLCLLLGSINLSVDAVRSKASSRLEQLKKKATTAPTQAKVEALEAEIQQIEDDLDSESCYYNLFLQNYNGQGFSGANVQVLLDGEPAEGFEVGVTLPIYVQESGWVIPVTSGQTISVVYDHNDLAESQNQMYITGVNGETVWTVESLAADQKATIGQATCSCIYITEAERCPSLFVRNEWRSLTYCDKANFIAGMLAIRPVMDDDGANMYDKYTILHYDITIPIVAAHNLLLPWHREMLRHFENRVRELGGRFSCFTLPYWDWALDYGLENRSEVYADLGGMHMDPFCLEAPFNGAEWKNPILALDDQCVMRRFFPTGVPFNPAFATYTSMQLGETVVSNYTFVFKYMVRCPHKAVHMYIGGDMKSFASPADPLFWLHHSNVDRMWATWQDCWDYDQPGTTELQYDNIGGTTPYSYMPQVFPGYANATIESVFDIDALRYRYPPVVDSFARLNRNHPVTAPKMCKWDWFSREQHVAQGLTFRIQVHNDVQRSRLSAIRQAYQTELQNSGDHYRAITAQLKTECDLGDYSSHDELTTADGDPDIGPKDLFKNHCYLLENDMLDQLFYE